MIRITLSVSSLCYIHYTWTRWSYVRGETASARSSDPGINVNTVVQVNRHSCTITSHRYNADIIKWEATNGSPFENRGKVATLYSITLDLFSPPHRLLFPLLPINFSCCRWTDTNTIYITQRDRNRANKICKTHSPKQHLLVSVRRLIESLCAVNSVECSLTNILTYLAQLVLH